MHGLLHDLGITLMVATAVGYIVERLKQPAIVAYLIGGIIIGPEIGPQLVTNTENIETISEIGLILLLFILGLEMNPVHLFSILRKVYIAGVGQFLLTVLSGVLLFLSLGFALSGSNLEALYLALATSLSSTAIVIKILTDKSQIDSHSGRLTFGILLFQDVWAILLLAIQPNLANPGLTTIVAALGKSLLLVVLAFVFSKYLLARLFEPIAKSPETVIVLSLGWCVGVVSAASVMGLSMEMGALIAPLRDVFLILFFISLGMKIPWPDIRYVKPVALIIAFTFVSRFLIVIPLSLMGKTNFRNSFLTALNLAQVSEFALVITALGVNYRHIGQETMGSVLFAMSVTSITSAYLIQYNTSIYIFFDRLFARLHRPPVSPAAGEETSHKPGKPITILGYHRGAQALIEFISLRMPELLEDMLVIDFNIESVRDLEAHKIAHFYGDFSHSDTLLHAGVAESKIIVSSIPDLLLRGTNNIRLVRMCRALNSEAFIIATADLNHQINDLKNAGANEVLLPYFEAAAHLSEVLVALSKNLRSSEISAIGP
jgi:Kef-type K+ transport system membrane component KefB